MQPLEVLHKVGRARVQGGEQFNAANDCASGKILVNFVPGTASDDDVLVEIIDQLIGGQDPFAALVAANDNVGHDQVEAIDPMAGIADEGSW
ncbi:hypothetical protein ACIQTU_08590 [Brevundimonas sp. NPDC090276]|uniref:hypothetical protein n=1 Tax=Brevundimonas sp. NPDC090276 TaxID=3363956 RepID=UPI00383A49D8